MPDHASSPDFRQQLAVLVQCQSLHTPHAWRFLRLMSASVALLLAATASRVLMLAFAASLVARLGRTIWLYTRLSVLQLPAAPIWKPCALVSSVGSSAFVP